MQRVTWILSLLWNQMMILSLEEKTCEASNWISFTYYLFWEDFEANDEHARSWELLVVYSASLSLLERMLRGNRARLSVNCLVSFQLHSASQLISCAIRIDLKIMQRCTGKWGPILLSPFFVMGPFFTFVESAHASCEKTTMCVFWE